MLRLTLSRASQSLDFLPKYPSPKTKKKKVNQEVFKLLLLFNFNLHTFRGLQPVNQRMLYSFGICTHLFEKCSFGPCCYRKKILLNGDSRLNCINLDMCKLQSGFMS